eukprot:CAMPEP_0179326660 /NCGR_PEP_ID=MMETSP0797-20121207/61545_1 /TAXON_ID=47934 /ORGANISM="Dinophysis acuminata, Strain DAEP01" /LENGTH=183 /DNA_ID=CAMNT_0021038929 /DNA_START=30 /DNA_END=581 /DNA_ORIENTATION=-
MVRGPRRESAFDAVLHALRYLLHELLVVDGAIVLGIPLLECCIQVRTLVCRRLLDGLEQRQELPLVDGPRVAAVLVPDHPQHARLGDVGASEATFSPPSKHGSVDLRETLRPRAADPIVDALCDFPEKLVEIDHTILVGVPFAEGGVQVRLLVRRGLEDCHQQVQELVLVDLPVVRHAVHLPH